jgi:glycosyltransferase involved in cell wall biosynthesis
MYDILFDFSSSPIGGGLRRLEAYAEYFSRSSLKTHFFVHDQALNRTTIQRLVPTTLVHKTSVSKLLLKNSYFREFNVGAKWLYSYGIPTKRGIADRNWLHISNVLPFFLFHATIEPSLLFKMLILRKQYQVNCRNNDIISAESNFSVQRYAKVTGWDGKSIVLKNGVHEVNSLPEPKQPFAVAVGTLSYKRIDRTYQLFQGLKKSLGLKKLLIVGDSTRVPEVIRTAVDVEVRGFLSETEMQSSLRQASYFISTSEVENSSCAVLEGLQFTQKAILSNIPSHMEMLIKDLTLPPPYQGINYLIVDQADINDDAIVKWSAEIEKMLVQMGF